MVKKYDNVIYLLEQIIEHWFDKEKLATFINLKSGLCGNLTCPEEDDEHMFTDVSDALYVCIRDYNIKQNKIKHVGLLSTFYPVELSSNEYNQNASAATLYNNPKRFHLAVFMLAWFRQHNMEFV
jgi:hypothetical protein